MVIVILTILLSKTTEILRMKSSEFKYSPFFEHAQDYDVLFMGTSHVLNAVFPMELWNDYGITSYNFGGHANQLATTYWVLKNSLDYAKPKAVVIDCLMLEGMQKTADNFSYVHQSLDAFPLSTTKIDTVNDLLEDEEVRKLINEGEITDAEKRTKLSLLWDFSVYHTRWDENLGEDEFVTSSTLEYGAESRVQIASPGQIVINPGTTFQNETVGMMYLKKMIDECQTNGIDVLLVYLPFPIENETQWISANTVKKIAEEYNVNYINFQEENIVDFRTDCYDSNSHLNPSGAWKVTGYLGEYLTQNYNIKDHRGEDKYSYWDEDYTTYVNMKNNRLKGIKDLNSYLMLLEDSNYGFVMDIDDVSVLKDSTTLALLENKGVNVSLISDKTKYIIVCGNVSEVVDSDILTDGLYGNIRINVNDEGQYCAYYDKQELFVLNTNTFEISESRIKLSVFNIHEPNILVDTGEFGIPKQLGLEERYPNQYGITVLSSKAIRQ